MAQVDTITVTICAELCEHCENFMRKKCPPPRSWDGVKKLPWPIVIYCKGKSYFDIDSYNLDTGTFGVTQGNLIKYNHCEPNGFLVQRLH